MATVQATPIAASATKPPVPKKKPTIPPKPSAPAKALTATPSSEEGESVSFNNQLKGIAWRIDVKTRTKHIKELNEAAAIVELDVKGAENQIVRFEMDAAQVKDVVAQLARIEAAINSS